MKYLKLIFNPITSIAKTTHSCIPPTRIKYVSKNPNDTFAIFESTKRYNYE